VSFVPDSNRPSWSVVSEPFRIIKFWNFADFLCSIKGAFTFTYDSGVHAVSGLADCEVWGAVVCGFCDVWFCVGAGFGAGSGCSFGEDGRVGKSGSGIGSKNAMAV
jgi:hypothetical protein